MSVFSASVPVQVSLAVPPHEMVTVIFGLSIFGSGRLRSVPLVSAATKIEVFRYCGSGGPSIGWD